MDRACAGIANAAIETAQVCAFLDNGLSKLLEESLPGAGIGAGICDFAGVDTSAGGGDERDEHISEKGG